MNDESNEEMEQEISQLDHRLSLAIEEKVIQAITNLEGIPRLDTPVC
jgi:hypothetical protein